jgi:hypothetical protein
MSGLSTGMSSLSTLESPDFRFSDFLPIPIAAPAHWRTLRRFDVAVAFSAVTTIGNDAILPP